MAVAPASADTLDLLGLKEYPDQCDLRLTRAALSLDLEIPENLAGVTDVFCSCEVVSIEMLEFIRRNRHLEVLLDSTSNQCAGFANVLADVTTASIGGGASGPDNGRLDDDSNGNGGVKDDDDKTDDDDDQSSDGGDHGTDGGDGGDGGTDGGDGGDGGTDGGDNGTD
ncbi:MAG: hypothetical protein KDK53_21910, partial [Maritimibacter sp.]|nr:hypothetical protein [Maritimibacter sp.]